MTAEVRHKANVAGAQLVTALESAADAFKTLASIIPSVLPQDLRTASISSAGPIATSTKTTSSANKRKREERDPGAPEKPITAYRLWTKENKDRVKASMPGITSASEVVAELNRLWKDVGDAVKKSFQELADKDKARYNQESAVFGPSKKAPESDEIPAASVSQRPQSPAKEATLSKGGFTAVDAAPLSLNPKLGSDSDNDSEDETAVAAELGAAPPSPKRHKSESGTKRKEGKEKSKDKERSEGKKRRRKSGKVDP